LWTKAGLGQKNRRPYLKNSLRQKRAWFNWLKKKKKPKKQKALVLNVALLEGGRNL
jgi:hypothetical protein